MSKLDLMNSEMKMVIGGISAIILIILVALIVACVQSKMESDTYNHLTGAHTTWWDAFWVELRVTDAPRLKD